MQPTGKWAVFQLLQLKLELKSNQFGNFDFIYNSNIKGLGDHGHFRQYKVIDFL